MKKLIVLLSIVFLTNGCAKEKESCYTFTVTETTRSSPPNIAGYPQTTTSVTQRCGLTDEEAKGVANVFTFNQQYSYSGYTVFVVSTCTY